MRGDELSRHALRATAAIKRLSRGRYSQEAGELGNVNTRIYDHQAHAFGAHPDFQGHQLTMNQELVSFLKAAIECSVYISPLEPGLTYDELHEVGKRVGYLQGEINDALPQVGLRFGVPRVTLTDQDAAVWGMFLPDEPDYRDYSALDFVFNLLNFLLRSEGEDRAAIERSVLVERAVAQGIQRHNIEVAITWLLMAKQLALKDNLLRFATRGTFARRLPSVSRGTHNHKRSRPDISRACPIVKDVIARRTDGRHCHPEPLDAFAEELENLGYKAFRMWWTQTVSELRQLDPSSNPVAVAVLAAALVEGALTFVVKHARTNGQFQSKEYEREPRNWKVDDLVASAASGGPTAVLDLQSKARAETLIHTRQRIHAGRMLSEYPAGPPDLRPDKARDAKGAVDQIIRAVLDWLGRNPPPAAP